METCRGYAEAAYPQHKNEEAYELEDEKSFNRIDESIRGEVPQGYFKQFTITFNPWSASHWLKARFFDSPNDDVLAKTTNYLCNEFLDEADKKLFEEMKKNDPERYKVVLVPCKFLM